MGILGGDGWDDYCSGCARLEKQLDKMEQYADSTRVRYYKLVKMLDEAVECYRHYLWKQIQAGVITVEMLLALDGKRLACYCVPQRCHGESIVAAIEWAKKEKANGVD